jgi:hypothetical protein
MIGLNARGGEHMKNVLEDIPYNASFLILKSPNPSEMEP